MENPDIWTDEFLTALRQEGDTEADLLAEKLFTPSEDKPFGGRIGYNPILDLADTLVDSSELALTGDSEMSKRLGKYNPELQRYYHPMLAPDWVDSEKLKLATKIWEKNSLSIIGVLYASSLPACYLIKRGIPALYDTGKLKEHKYIFQRIYETGVMLNEVMSKGGIRVVNDVGQSAEEVINQALCNLDPSGAWKVDGNRIVRGKGEHNQPNVSSVQSEIQKIRSNESVKRYLWGSGFICAKKVRMLHSSMRFMLQKNESFQKLKQGTPEGVCPFHTDPSKPLTLSEQLQSDESSWPTEENGVPINQEDLAYTLLTFAYLIPKGLEHWGARISREEKDAFLHLWKVIGHTMGLREDLLTDNWDNAGILFERIARLECGHSEDGVALTEAVQFFLESYLPNVGGLDKRWSALLIVDQLGWDRAKLILNEESQRRARSLYARTIHVIFLCVIRFYYRIYQRFIQRNRLLSGFFCNTFERSTEELIRSWKSAYWRKPFYVPINLTTWVRKRGADEEFEKRLKHWRENVFLGVMASLGSLLLCLTTFLGWINAWFFEHTLLSSLFGWSTIGLILSWLLVSEVYLPWIFNRRPEIEEDMDHAVNAH